MINLLHRDRHPDTQTHRQKDRLGQRNKKTNSTLRHLYDEPDRVRRTDTPRYTDTQTDRHTDTQTHRQTQGQRGRETVRQTTLHTNTQTERQPERRTAPDDTSMINLTDGQTDTGTEI